jgi:hypothetical protein
MGALKFFAALFGVGFIAIGVMGYMPDYVQYGNLFGYFEVDDVHNIIHITSGVVALLCAFSGFLSRLYFQVFGLLYGIVTILGFLFAGDLFIMHVNMADNILHLVISVVALFLGFIF